jgi:nucleoside-diphosphate-sugar epimerase
VKQRMSTPRVLILGCGFTGQRVARELLRLDVPVLCTSRTGTPAVDGATTLALDVNDADSIVRWCEALVPGLLVLYSIPSMKHGEKFVDRTPAICHALKGQPPARVVYLSTTGVYGETRMVNERTAPAPNSERELLRAEAERAVMEGPWSSLILRPAAIYGPGRGVHAAVRAGNFRVSPDGTRMTSRIHVDDLAEHAARALFSDLPGAYPVADEEPCSSLQVAQWSAELLGLLLPPAAPIDSLSETRRPDRQVDGSAIRRLLGIELRYPSYRTGIPACVKEESVAGISANV